MDQTYWLKRKRSSLARAQTATSAEARLVHFDLAGRYSVKAVNAAPSPTEADNVQ
ncbi:MAG: hypothetical protein ABIU10_04045 [Sphingomicrobium sp.]